MDVVVLISKRGKRYKTQNQKWAIKSLHDLSDHIFLNLGPRALARVHRVRNPPRGIREEPRESPAVSITGVNHHIQG